MYKNDVKSCIETKSILWQARYYEMCVRFHLEIGWNILWKLMFLYEIFYEWSCFKLIKLARIATVLVDIDFHVPHVIIIPNIYLRICRFLLANHQSIFEVYVLLRNLSTSSFCFLEMLYIFYLAASPCLQLIQSVRSAYLRYRVMGIFQNIFLMKFNFMFSQTMNIWISI